MEKVSTFEAKARSKNGAARKKVNESLLNQINFNLTHSSPISHCPDCIYTELIMYMTANHYLFSWFELTIDCTFHKWNKLVLKV